MIDDKTLGWGKKITGFTELVDSETGEVKLANEVKSSIVDVKWEKVWLHNLLFALGILSSSSLKVVMYFFEKRNYENIVFATKEMVIRQTGISRGTVYDVIKKLIKNNIIKELEMGFQVNPHIVFNSQKAKKEKITRLDVVMSYDGFNYKDKETIEVKEDK